jgi:hypothetical protein
MHHKKTFFESRLTKRFCLLAILSIVIGSCEPESQNPTDSSPSSNGSGGSALNRAVDTSGSQNHAVKRTSKETPLNIDFFMIDNASTQSLGNVTISSSMESNSLMVGPSQMDTLGLAFNPSSVTINSQVCAYPDSNIIALPTGAMVSVGWQSPNLISVLDYVQQN